MADAPSITNRLAENLCRVGMETIVFNLPSKVVV